MNNSRTVTLKNAKFSGHYFYTNSNILGDFQICISLPLNQRRTLKVQLCKLHNNKCMTASTQITNTEIFAFITALVFKLLGRKVLFINRKDKRNC